MHALDPARAYVPAVQLRHTLAVIAPDTLENDPAGHATHVVAPVTSEYDPADLCVEFVERIGWS